MAVLLTAHNRRRETLSCLQRVRAQRLDEAVRVDVILVDDGSTDATASAVRDQFPDVEVIDGTGELYWNGGMRVAFEHAVRRDYDYYVLLNDDTHLEPDALRTMLRTYREVAAVDRAEAIVVGSTRDPHTGALTYGGWRSVRRLHPANCVRAEPSDGPQPCDTMNGNCVLIPRAVAERVGNLDARFTHRMGDMDYGFRAKRAGCALWLAPGYVGTCEANRGARSWMDPTLGVRESWRRLVGPKGLPPREWLVFTSRHSGVLWPLYWLKPYVTFWLAAVAAALRGNRGNG